MAHKKWTEQVETYFMTIFAFLLLKCRKNHTIDHKVLAHIIQELGCPENSDKPPGSKEGSYWYTISMRYM